VFKLISKDEPNQHSATFQVTQGEAVLLSAIGFKDCHEKVFIERLILSGNTPTSKESCGKPICNLGGNVTIVAAIPLRLCGNFYLGEDQPMGILNIPGYYRVTLNSPKAIGYVEVYIETLSKKDVGAYPASLLLGNKT